jgi:hypothetical protein
MPYGLGGCGGGCVRARSSVSRLGSRPLRGMMRLCASATRGSRGGERLARLEAALCPSARSFVPSRSVPPAARAGAARCGRAGRRRSRRRGRARRGRGVPVRSHRETAVADGTREPHPCGNGKRPPASLREPPLGRQRPTRPRRLAKSMSRRRGSWDQSQCRSSSRTSPIDLVRRGIGSTYLRFRLRYQPDRPGGFAPVWATREIRCHDASSPTPF